MSTVIEQAAEAVVAEWRMRPHAVIHTSLRRAIEALDKAFTDTAAAGRLQETHAQRELDLNAWEAWLRNDIDAPGM